MKTIHVRACLYKYHFEVFKRTQASSKYWLRLFNRTILELSVTNLTMADFRGFLNECINFWTRIDVGMASGNSLSKEPK